MRFTSSSSFSLRAWRRLLSLTTEKGSMKRVAPDSDSSRRIPGTFWAIPALTGTQ